ncbi:MAG: MazG nucleotide pyrophosphohydrolase domain-containing protein [Candidatus Hodarchaeales archaeon]
MELIDLTKKVDTFIKSNNGYWDLPWLLAAIVEELGELSKTLQLYSSVRQYENMRHTKTELKNVKEECGDLFFALICLTNYLDINLEEALLHTVEKYSNR